MMPDILGISYDWSDIDPLEKLAECYLADSVREKLFKYLEFKEMVIDMPRTEEREFYWKLGLGFCFYSGQYKIFQ